MTELVLSFLTPFVIEDFQYARTFFENMLKYMPSALPAVYDEVEPPKLPFDINDLSEMEEIWEEEIFWLRKDPKASGGVAHANRVRHSMIDFSIDFSVGKNQNFISMLEVTSDYLGVDYAYAHPVSKSSRKDDEILGGVTSFHLKEYLPSLPWLTCYGKPYIDLFGKERLLSQPIYRAEEISNDMVVCQLTEDIDDVVNDFEGFDLLRTQVKKHLGENAFLDLEDKGRKCDVPTFEYMLQKT